MKRALGRQAGFSLIEVLVAAVVVAVGLLSVASLHSRLVAQSSDSKARAEAVALAQARIEDMRNYTNEIDSRTEFDTEFAATAGDFVNDTTLDGVNATFTRSEAIGNVGDAKQIQILVNWTDAAGVGREVTMATQLIWESPRAVGDLARADASPMISGPTGRARIGEGLVPDGVTLEPAADDGTQIWDDGSGDLKLVVEGPDGRLVVLTLLDACQVDESEGNTCLDFVKINGRVYIDTDTQNNMDPGEVHVIASDASYCQRYYVTGDGDTVVVSDSTTSALTTPTGDYEYFDYRCYVGGGWYGNIGILLTAGIKQSDKMCQGDPTRALGGWDTEPRIAARRAYRGMLLKENGIGGWVEDANGAPVYFTVGIGDGVELPDPSYPEWVAGASYAAGDIVVYDRYAYLAQVSHDGVTADPQLDWRWMALGGQGTHDFVISSLATSHTDGSYCIDDRVMVRTDSYVSGVAGGLFAGMPNDFVCLNPDHTDAFSGDYDAPVRCPYPPTNGPAIKHTVSGLIVLPPNANLDEPISVQTSDGVGTCTRDGFLSGGGSVAASYSCDVYEWGGGWNGFVMIDPNSYGVLCTDSGVDGAQDDQLNLSDIMLDVTGNSFQCTLGNWALITGTVGTANLNRTLSSAEISSNEGWCTVASDGLSYACTTGIFGSTWSGTITLTTTDGEICGVGASGATGTVTFSGVAAGPHERNIGIVKNSNEACPL